MPFDCGGQSAELLYLDDARRAFQDADAAAIALVIIDPEYGHGLSLGE
jgi:hypothetical protein